MHFKRKNALTNYIFFNKKGNKLDPLNYRPISLLSRFSKILENTFSKRLIGLISNYHNLITFKVHTIDVLSENLESKKKM